MVDRHSASTLSSSSRWQCNQMKNITSFLFVLIAVVLVQGANAATSPSSSSSVGEYSTTSLGGGRAINDVPAIRSSKTNKINNKTTRRSKKLRHYPPAFVVNSSTTTTGDKIPSISVTRGGGGKNTPPAAVAAAAAAAPVPSMYWAVLHNWLYFLSLGFNAVNIPYMVREIVDGPSLDGKKLLPSPKSIALSGNVEAVDKILTFGGIAFLSALSDKYGRKPLMVWSAFGFAITNLLQAFAGGGGHTRRRSASTSTAILYLADFVDGCSSCMGPVCQAYVADCTARTNGGASLASNLGIFQGISIGGAFMFAFPIGGLLGAKYGPKLPILMAAGFQFVNCLIALFVTPESNNIVGREKKQIRFSEVNPITGLQKLFGIGKSAMSSSSNSNIIGSASLLRTASLTYLCLCLARGALDAQFVNYSNIRFGWTQAQAGPVLVMTGFMLAVVPRILVPRLGLQNSINYGLLVYALGLSSAGLVSTSMNFVLSIAIVAIGCVSIPALQALLANLAPPGESGALLGAVGSLSELTGAIGSSMYATLLATFATSLSTSTSSSSSSSLDEQQQQQSILLSFLPKIPGMHFLVGASFCLIGWAISVPGLNRNKDHPALKMSVDN